MLAPAAAIDEEYYFSVLLDRANRTYLAMASREGGMEIEQLAVEKPEALARVAGRRARPGIDEAKAREIAEQGDFPEDVRDQVAAAIQKLWGVFVAEDATLVEVNPLVKTADGRIVALDGKVTLDENADFRQPDHAALEDEAQRRPARGQGQGEGPQLRQARRRGRHHRQRRRPGDEHARRRRLRRRGVRRREARELPRHRRRRLGRGDGQRPGDHPRRPVGQVGVRQRLRRHHGLRRGGQRHRAGVRSCCRSAATRSATRWSCGSTATTPRRAGASSPTRSLPLLEQVDTMDGAAQRAAELAAAGSERTGRGTRTWLSCSPKNSVVIVQGMTGSEGRKHTQRMLASGTQVVGGVNPQARPAETVDFDGSRRRCPSSARSARP